MTDKLISQCKVRATNNEREKPADDNDDGLQLRMIFKFNQIQ